MNIWRIVGALLIVALFSLGYLWEQGERQALQGASDTVNAHDERVRQMDEMARGAE